MGFEGWLPAGGGVLSVLTFLLIGFAKGWIWTKPQVDRLMSANDREIANLKERYETHIGRTISLLEGRINDSLTREREWHEIGTKALDVNREFANQMDAVVESQRTLISIIGTARRSIEGTGYDG